jgi:protein SCO1/2
MNTPLKKSILLFCTIFGVIAISVAFVILHHDDGENRVQYALINQDGQRVTQKDFSGRHQLVFFGFTSCGMVCPTQMAKLSRVMYELETSGHNQRVSPIFISVDPERDTPEKVKQYLGAYHQRFTGLTGSRVALKNTADSFKTLLAAAPKIPQKNYQVTHSSVVYVVDPFNRIIDFIPFEADVSDITQRVKALL